MFKYINIHDLITTSNTLNLPLSVDDFEKEFFESFPEIQNNQSYSSTDNNFISKIFPDPYDSSKSFVYYHQLSSIQPLLQIKNMLLTSFKFENIDEIIKISDRIEDYIFKYHPEIFIRNIDDDKYFTFKGYTEYYKITDKNKFIRVIKKYKEFNERTTGYQDSCNKHDCPNEYDVCYFKNPAELVNTVLSVYDDNYNLQSIRNIFKDQQSYDEFISLLAHKLTYSNNLEYKYVFYFATQQNLETFKQLLTKLHIDTSDNFKDDTDIILTTNIKSLIYSDNFMYALDNFYESTIFQRTYELLSQFDIRLQYIEKFSDINFNNCDHIKIFNYLFKNQELIDKYHEIIMKL